MKSSLVLAATGALLVAAGPVRNVKKAAANIKWVVDIVTVTVTATDLEAQPASTDCLEGTNAPAPVPAQTLSIKPFIHPSPPAPPPAPSSPSPAPAVSVSAFSASSPSPTPVITVVSSTTASSSPPATASAVGKMVAPAPAVAPPPAQNADYQTVMLYYHNVHRANHSVGDLTWDAGLAQDAEITAKTCVFQHDMHEGGGGYGQNLALWGSTGDIDEMGNKAGAYGANDQWYNGEVENWPSYDQNDGPTDRSLDSWAHFTQVVWKGSTHVGCSTIKCPAGTALSLPSWYTVCNYFPPGNFQGEYRANVLRPLGMKSVSVDL